MKQMILGVFLQPLSHCPSGILKGRATLPEEKGRKSSPDFLSNRIGLLDQESEILVLLTQPVVRAFMLITAIS